MNHIDRTPFCTQLLPQLQQLLEQADQDRLIDCLGYRGTARAHAARHLHSLRQATRLAEWLWQSGFDFRHTRSSFFLALGECLSGADRAAFATALEEAERERARLAALYPAWINVELDIKGLGFMGHMPFSGWGHITLDKRGIRDDFLEELARIQRIVRRHHAAFLRHGPRNGRIRKYDWHLGPGQILCLDVDGTPLPNARPEPTPWKREP